RRYSCSARWMTLLSSANFASVEFEETAADDGAGGFFVRRLSVPASGLHLGFEAVNICLRHWLVEDGLFIRPEATEDGTWDLLLFQYLAADIFGNLFVGR